MSRSPRPTTSPPSTRSPGMNRPASARAAAGVRTRPARTAAEVARRRRRIGSVKAPVWGTGVAGTERSPARRLGAALATGEGRESYAGARSAPDAAGAPELGRRAQAVEHEAEVPAPVHPRPRHRGAQARHERRDVV